MGDLISRQAAIDAIETKIKKWNAVDGEGYHVGLGLRYTDVIDTLTDLPSAQPEPLTLTIDHTPTKDEYDRLKQAMMDTPILLFPPAQPERKNVWHNTLNDGFPAEGDQVLVTNGKHFWLDESVANDVGLMWEGDGSTSWERTEWAYPKDLYER